MQNEEFCAETFGETIGFIIIIELGGLGSIEKYIILSKLPNLPILYTL